MLYHGFYFFALRGSSPVHPVLYYPVKSPGWERSSRAFSFCAVFVPCGPFLCNMVRRNRCGDLTFRRLSNSFFTELPDDSVGKIAVLWPPTTTWEGCTSRERSGPPRRPGQVGGRSSARPRKGALILAVVLGIVPHQALGAWRVSACMSAGGLLSAMPCSPIFCGGQIDYVHALRNQIRYFFPFDGGVSLRT